MPRLTPSGLAPGMVTARSVVNSNGMVLLGENTELSAELIDRIKNMDVDAVYVLGSIQPSRPREEFIAEIENRFRLVAGDPNMLTVLNAITRHIEGLYV